VQLAWRLPAIKEGAPPFLHLHRVLSVRCEPVSTWQSSAFDHRAREAPLDYAVEKPNLTEMTMTRRNLVGLLGLLPLSRAAAALGRPLVAASSGPVEIRMEDRPNGTGAFVPAAVTIAVGSTVRWINGGSLLHTVTFDPAQAKDALRIALPPGVAPFGSDDLAKDDTYEHRFDVAGTYCYICHYHERMGMAGTIVVANR